MRRTLAFCLYKYFPHGGLQRDMLRIALACQARGHTVDVYTTGWQGEVPDGLQVHSHPPRGWTNHRRMQHYHAWMTGELAQRPADCVVGFNKIPDLDVYYAADGCYLAEVLRGRSPLYRLMPRCRQYIAFENAVFSPDSKTHILTISKIQESLYIKHYGTPSERFHSMPPNVAPDRAADGNAFSLRMAFRQAQGLTDEDRVLLQLGSDFRRKGLDRSIKALASLPAALRARTRLYVVGESSQRPYARLAKHLGVTDRVVFLGPRDDVPQLLVAADLLLHPAYYENTGTVLLEALTSGLPVVASGVCGYAHYIDEADAGWVVPEPFEQSVFNEIVRTAFEQPDLREIGRRGIEFSQREDLSGMVEAAVKVIEALATRRDTARDLPRKTTGIADMREPSSTRNSQVKA